MADLALPNALYFKYLIIYLNNIYEAGNYTKYKRVNKKAPYWGKSMVAGGRFELPTFGL